jgi:hypothetical protein
MLPVFVFKKYTNGEESMRSIAEYYYLFKYEPELLDIRCMSYRRPLSPGERRVPLLCRRQIYISRTDGLSVNKTRSTLTSRSTDSGLELNQYRGDASEYTGKISRVSRKTQIYNWLQSSIVEHC